MVAKGEEHLYILVGYPEKKTYNKFSELYMYMWVNAWLFLHFKVSCSVLGTIL